MVIGIILIFVAAVTMLIGGTVNLKNGVSPIKGLEWPYNSMNYISVKDMGVHPLKVAIIDTGIDLSQACFKNVDIKTYSAGGDYKTSDRHGTLVAGIICGSRLLRDNNLLKSTSFYSIDVGTDDNIKLESLIEGIKLAVKQRVDIINLSIGAYKNDPELKSAIDAAFKNNIIVVCAAGNDSTKQYAYPAGYDGVISVSGVDANGEYLLNNNINDKVIVCAPGERIPTHIYDKDNHGLEVMMNGTSASAALITDVAIALKSVKEDLYPGEMARIIKNTSEDLGAAGKDSYYGYGLINYKKAVLYEKNSFLYRLYDLFCD